MLFNISNIKGIARSINSIIIFSSITGGILSDSFQIFFLGLLCIFSELFVNFEKEYIFKYLYKNNLIPKFFGRGKRPIDAINCSQFIDETNFNKPSTSFGMPSGHSQLIMASCVYLIQYVLEHQKNPAKRKLSISMLLFLAISFMYSRIHFNCHTIQQVLFGGSMGGFLGYFGYKFMKKINEKIKLQYIKKIT